MSQQLDYGRWWTKSEQSGQLGAAATAAVAVGDHYQHYSVTDLLTINRPRMGHKQRTTSWTDQETPSRTY